MGDGCEERLPLHLACMLGRSTAESLLQQAQQAQQAKAPPAEGAVAEVVMEGALLPPLLQRELEAAAAPWLQALLRSLLRVGMWQVSTA